MQSLDYQKAVRRSLGLADLDIVALPAATVLSALNDSLKAIAFEWNWNWLYTETSVLTVANTGTVAIPSNHTGTVFITVDNGPPIAPGTTLDLSHDRTVTGRPTSYVIEATTIRLLPTPDAVYQVVQGHYRSEPALVADGDSPLLPDIYSPWLVADAALRLAFRTNSADKYGMLKEEVAVWRSRALGEIKREKNTGATRVRRVRSPIWSGF